jgi:undecaprenyl-diphosphatase
MAILNGMNAFQSLDQSIVISLNNLLANHALGVVVAKIAIYGVYLIPIIWLVWWFLASQKQRLILLSSLLAGILAWQGLNRIVKLLYFHQRPTQNLPVHELLFSRPENSFPSDHAAFLAAIAFFFLLRGQKKNGFWFLGLAILVSLARVMVAVHYPSDILAGFLDGFIVAYLVNLAHDWLTDTVWDYLLTLARKLHLA